MTGIEERCRLVLVMPDMADTDLLVDGLTSALKGGDVASVILPQYGLDERAYQKRVTACLPIVQAAGVAAFLAGDERVAVRTQADGVHVEATAQDVSEAMERLSPGLMVGAGGITSRHMALQAGEAQPDYVMFGKLDGDIRKAPHPANIALGEWWSSMIEIPCIVMGGSDVESVVAVADTGAEFVALRMAIFADPAMAALKVSQANALLDANAPRFAT